ncbi:ALDH-like protein [Glonium stellatum]|uniref:ALDH-like protein n=1 Tax=Glonium stellatum TaxID=574774 RepID=A0A8E2JS51_9PEZI|nr:ALDH-like protein [Glonium stellatum]
MSSTKPFPRIRAAAIDGRLSNIYYRRTQLEQLHDSLTQNAQAIRNAIVHDSRNTQAEAAIEYHLALSSLKEQYSSLDPTSALEYEYRVEHGVDAPDRRERAGLVYIVPTVHTLFFSVISPLSAAIAAGNCVIVQLENNLRELFSLLRKLLRAALDVDIFDIADGKPTDGEFLNQCIEVLQVESIEPLRINQIVSPAAERVVAIVDRTADLQEAAKALVTARFSFGGRSPYAPDTVLVNEFVKKNFLDAVVQQSIGFLTGRDGNVIGNGKPTRSQSRAGNLPKDIQEDGIRIVTSGSNGSIIDIEKRISAVLHSKIRQCCLPVCAVRSLDDAIDLANSNNSILLASYVFAAPRPAKYLSQFIYSRAAFVNHIPTELLVGPAAPLNHPTTSLPRYSVTLFSQPRPHYVKPHPKDALLGKLLRASDAKVLRQLEEHDTAGLLNRKERPLGGGLGFFEQGFIIGATVLLTPLAVGLGVLSIYGYRAASSRWW